MALTPACSSILASSTALMLPLSQPRRIFTVTGTGLALHHRLGEAGGLLRVFHQGRAVAVGHHLAHGQPMLMSMTAAPETSAAMTAASAIQVMSLPKIWAAAGRSLSASFKRPRLFFVLIAQGLGADQLSAAHVRPQLAADLTEAPGR